MGSTPRAHRYQIPLATRSTDVSTIAQCPGRFALQCFYEQEQAPASFFMLGTQLHESIEVAINLDLDLDQTLAHASAGIDRQLEHIPEGVRVIESSGRGVADMRANAETMLKQWFKTVHVDSPDRLAIYSEYEWPPRTEVEWKRYDGTKYPVWGSIDVLWTSRGATKHHAITDWKSSKDKQRSSDQLHFYRYGLGLGDIPAWFHRLNMQQERSVIQHADPYPGDDAVRQRVLATEAIKDQVVAGRYPKFEPSFLCNYCPVQDVCPADGDVRNREANASALRRMLKLARGMVELPEKEVA